MVVLIKVNCCLVEASVLLLKVHCVVLRKTFLSEEKETDGLYFLPKQTNSV